MLSIKEKINEIVEKVKKDNPNANWKNLATGVAILVLLPIFSVWYFSQTPAEISLSDDELEFVLEENGDVSANEGEGEMNENGNAGNVSGMHTGETTTVQAGEGLWQVAERVCGDGEAYAYIAEANNLSIWWAPTAPGQELVVACGPANADTN